MDKRPNQLRIEAHNLWSPAKILQIVQNSPTYPGYTLEEVKERVMMSTKRQPGTAPHATIGSPDCKNRTTANET